MWAVVNAFRSFIVLRLLSHSEILIGLTRITSVHYLEVLSFIDNGHSNHVDSVDLVIILLNLKYQRFTEFGSFVVLYAIYFAFPHQCTILLLIFCETQ